MTTVMFGIPSDLSVRKVIITPEAVDGADPLVVRDPKNLRQKLGAKA